MAPANVAVKAGVRRVVSNSSRTRGFVASSGKAQATVRGEASSTAPIRSEGVLTAYPVQRVTETHSSTRHGPWLTPFNTRAAVSGPLKADSGHDLTWNGKDLLLTDQGDSASTLKVNSWWLRDHCPCSICMNQVTKQRQVNNLNGLAKAPSIHTASIPGGRGRLEVTWADGHQSTFEHDFVQRKHSPTLEAVRRGNTRLNLWNSSVAQTPPSVSYSELQDGRYGSLLEQIRVNGFCFIDGTPATPEASEAIMKDIGPIRETHYGGFTVVTSDLTSKDTAYTSEALEPHTDNTYFSDGAGLQMLHMLSHEQGSGGESLFIDGFKAAQQLYDDAPELYQALATYGIYAHSTGNEGVHIQPCDAIPVLRHDLQNTELIQVRWNNADRAGVAAPQDKMDLWYEAASKFQELLDREENRYWIQLKPGSPIIFDNWRVLHGRSEFTGIRKVCGAYINHDDYISKFKTTNFSEADLAAATVSG